MCFVVDVEKSQLEAGWVLLSQEKDKKSQTIMPNDIELESCAGICLTNVRGDLFHLSRICYYNISIHV